MGMNNSDRNKTALPETGTCIKTIELKNGQPLILTDRSRKISADAYIVIMQATMEIKITPNLFDNEPLSGVTVDQIRDTLGETVIYEYRLERNFILNHAKDEVLATLVDTFMKNMENFLLPLAKLLLISDFFRELVRSLQGLKVEYLQHDFQFLILQIYQF